ncbi:protein FIP2-like [Rosa sericea]
MSTVVTTALPKPRRVPPPCWTQDEARSLILAYRDRWFALRRTNLKSADWDHVSAATATAAPSSPPKTALQCRHKMEKLRKRYRAEKQRASRYPGRFSSSWALFHLMDEMESGPDRELDSGGEFGGGFSLKARNLVKFDGNVDRDFSPDVDENSSFYSEGDDCVNQGFRPKSNGKTDVNLKHSFRQHGDYGVDFRSDRDFVPAGFRPKSSGIVDGNVKRNVRFKEFDGYSCLSGSKFVEKSGVVGIKRDVDPVEDLASSIMRLGEGFVRMEKMKMEMTMEIEKMRMEMELKRNEAMIESHQQIVDAFVNALLEMKKKKKAKVESSHA